MNKFSKIIAITFVCSFVLILSSCGNANSDKPNETATQNASVTDLTSSDASSEKVKWSYNDLHVPSKNVEYELNRTGQPAEPVVVGNKAQDIFVWLRNARIVRYKESDTEENDAIFLVLQLINQTTEIVNKYDIGLNVQVYQDDQQLELSSSTNNFEFDYIAREYPDIKTGDDLKHGNYDAKPNDGKVFKADYKLLNTTSPVKVVLILDYNKVEYTFDLASVPLYENLPD